MCRWSSATGVAYPDTSLLTPQPARFPCVKFNPPRTRAHARWAAEESRTQAERLSRRISRRDPELAMHSRVVGQYAAMTARALGVPKATADSLRLAGEL